LPPAREALEKIDAGARYDVILCDLMMPELTGIDLHAELGRTAPELQARMIFVTGGAFTPEAQRFLETTVQPWIAKPFDAATLKEMIAARLT
jgi:CheY-like chemotaxis protein